MKKLLIIAILTLFVANAYALDFKTYGFFETTGRWIINNSIGDDDSKGNKNRNETYLETKFRIWGELGIDSKTKIVFRTTPLDNHRWGDGWNTKGNGSVILDRAFIQYEIMDGLTLQMGRISGNNFATYGWAQGLADGTFVEAGQRDGAKLAYKINDDVKVFAYWTKQNESSLEDMGQYETDGNGNGKDSDVYVLGSNMSFGDIKANAVLGYNNTYVAAGAKRTSLYSVYADAAYLPETGLNAILALAYIGGTNGGNLDTAVKSNGKYEDLSAWGVYGDVSYVTDLFKAGLFGAYSSWDKKSGAFSFGGDFDRTMIIDDLYGDSYGVSGYTMFQLYGEVTPVEKFTAAASFSYYLSNISKNGYETAMFDKDVIHGKDTNMFEFDLSGTYQLTPATALTAGYGLAFFTDLYSDAGKKYDSDAVHSLFWNVYTEF